MCIHNVGTFFRKSTHNITILHEFMQHAKHAYDVVDHKNVDDDVVNIVHVIEFKMPDGCR